VSKLTAGTDRPLVIAHRGGAGPHSENSIAAFENAVALGADMIELDVRCTKDGHLIVAHDPDLRGSPISGLTEQAISATGSGRPPFLAEVVARLGNRIALDIEIKESGYEQAVIAAVHTLAPGLLVLSSFRSEVVATVRQRAPHLSAGLICSPRTPAVTSLRLAREVGATHLVLHRRRAGPRALIAAGNWGLKVFVWTVNDPRDLVRFMADPGISGVVTDRVAEALAALPGDSGRAAEQ